MSTTNPESRKTYLTNIGRRRYFWKGTLWARIAQNVSKSVDSIVTHLNSSLEKLDVACTEIDSTALLQLRSVGTLKVLNCLDKVKGMRAVFVIVRATDLIDRLMFSVAKFAARSS